MTDDHHNLPDCPHCSLGQVWDEKRGRWVECLACAGTGVERPLKILIAE